MAGSLVILYQITAWPDSCSPPSGMTAQTREGWTPGVMAGNLMIFYWITVWPGSQRPQSGTSAQLECASYVAQSKMIAGGDMITGCAGHTVA